MQIKQLMMLALAGLGAAQTLHAGEIDIRKRADATGIKTITLIQKNMRKITIGINIVPIETRIETHQGEDVILALGGTSFLGSARPPEISFRRSGDALHVEMGYASKLTLGMRVGKLEAVLLLPESFSGILDLRDISTPTSIEDIHIEELKGELRNSPLSLQCSSFETVNIRAGGNSSIKVDSVQASEWKLKGSTGTIRTADITGEVTAETFDGTIDLSYRAFSGTSRLRSKAGSIRVSLPRETALELELSSGAREVKTDLALTGRMEGNSKRRITGRTAAAVSAGTCGNRLEAKSGSGTVKVYGSTP